MVTVRNHAKERLEAGELALGVGLRQARTVDIGRIMKTAGYDFLFIDMEHNSMSIDLAAQISVAAQDAGITPVVRVPAFEHFHATRALDAGAQGIVVPHVDTADIAARMVQYCMYPPLGHRSVTGALPQLDFRPAPLGEATAAINAATLLILMLETPEAIDNVEEIAAVPGFDVLLVGTNDLCMEMGIPGQLDHPRIGEAFERVIRACRAHGKHAGLGGVYDPPLMQRYLAMGFRLVLAGSDLSFMLGAATARAAAVRATATAAPAPTYTPPAKPVRWARNTVKWAPIPLARYRAEWQRAALPGATIVVARALNKRATPGSLKWWQFAHYVNHMPVADMAAAGIRPEWFARDLRYGHLRVALPPKAAAAKAANAAS